MFLMGLPGFTAELSLAASPRRYVSNYRATSTKAAGLAASDDPGLHCYYDSPWCANNTIWVKCWRWVNGIPRPESQAIGSCVSTTSGGGGGSFGRIGDGGTRGGFITGGGGSPGGIDIHGNFCDPSFDPACKPIEESR
jgi:hypothetical protein